MTWNEEVSRELIESANKEISKAITEYGNIDFDAASPEQIVRYSVICDHLKRIRDIAAAALGRIMDSEGQDANISNEDA